MDCRVDCSVGRTSARLGAHRLLYGTAKNASSPTIAHTSRPGASVNPATGFQAAVARMSMPSRSQPFHGRSLSLSVRRTTAELNPNCEVDRYILDPVGEVVGIELAPEPIANHRAVATAGQLRYQLACDVEPLGRVSVIRFDKPPIEFVGVLTLGRAADGGLQQVIGLEPALLDPGRCWPGIKADVGGAQHLVDGNLVEADVPVCRMKRKSVKHHVLAAGVLRAHGHRRHPRLRQPTRRASCLRRDPRDRCSPHGTA